MLKFKLYKIPVNLEIINLSRREIERKQVARAIERLLCARVRGSRGKTMLPMRVYPCECTWEAGEKGTSADRFGMSPMDLTESLAEALSRHFVFYFRESRADWTRRVNSARCNAL